MTMHRLVRSLVFGVLAALLAQTAPAAEPMRLISLEFAPYYTILEEGKPPSGFSYELLQELARRVGSSTEVEILPVPRAVDAMMKTPNRIGTATQTEARKPQFIWIAEVATDQLVVATPKGKRVRRLEDLPRDARLGLLLGSTMEQRAYDNGWRDYGIPSIDPMLSSLTVGRSARSAITVI